MASIWMRLDSVQTDEFVSMVVVPLIKSLGSRGIHANLEPTRNQIFQNEGNLAYALFPGGELGFFFTTGPTANTNSRFMMATVSGVPKNLGIDEEDVNEALRDFATGLHERDIYDAQAKITEGGSIGGGLRAKTSGQGGGQSKKSGCYVATAVYGGYDMPQVRVLRRFRDQTMGSNRTGRQAIRLYYRVSPVLVRNLGHRNWFTRTARLMLEPLVGTLHRAGFDDTPYTDPR